MTVGLAVVMSLMAGPVALPGVIPEAGQYDESYLGDWSTLPTGDQLARWDLAEVALEAVSGEAARQVWRDQDEVRISGLRWLVNWDQAAEKSRTTLFTVRNCKRVVIEDVVIIQADADYRGYDTIRIEDCDEVIVQRSHFGGTCQSYHLRLDGCAQALFDRVEVAGRDHGPDGVRCGGGIFIQNGATGRGGPRDNMLTTPDPRLLEWLTIRHCYFHDLLASGDGPRRNQDAILIHSPTAGIVFNCVVENWDQQHGDAAMDIGFRRTDLEGSTFRVERCVFRNCTLVKSPGGAGHPSNALIWCNNVFGEAFFGDYHGLWPLYLVNNTHLPAGRSPIYKLWGQNEGPVHFVNALVARDEPAYQMVYQNDQGDAVRYRHMAFEQNLYLIPRPDSWVTGAGARVADWDAWRAEGQDAGSRLLEPVDCFVDRAAGDLRPRPGSLPVGAGTGRFLTDDNPGLRVTRDFLGQPRPAQPAAGAFEPARD